jgi:predicted small metal-binding protein
MKNHIVMTKSISCKDAGKDCSWSAESTRNDDEELMSMVKEHVLAEHKEIELNPENIANIKSLIKVTKRFWWWG